LHQNHQLKLVAKMNFGLFFHTTFHCTRQREGGGFLLCSGRFRR